MTDAAPGTTTTESGSWQEMTYRVTLAIAAVVNLVPLMGLLGAPRLQALYGITITDPDLLVLMQHRALLFGLVGGLLALAVCARNLRPAATTIGMGSMWGFALIAALSDTSAALDRIMWVDVGAGAALLGGYVLDRSVRPGTHT